VVTRLEDSPRAYIYEQARWKLLSRTADLSDIPVDILSRIDPERIWIPQNYDPEYHGEMFLMDALRRSVNVCAVDLVMRLDPLNVIQMARRLGITSPLAPSPSLTLGGFEVTLIEMVRAYAVIPHEGIMVEPFAVFRVEDNNGNVLESNSSQETRVLTPQVSYVICWLLQQVAERGTGWYTKYLGRPRAGKTGTTNNFTDAWFIGFTPALICGVWTGYDQQVTLGSKKAGGVVSAPIWTDFMKKALEGSPQLDFKVSEGVSFVPVNRYTGLKTFPDDPGVMLVPFIAGTEPAEFHREDMLLTVPVEEEEESW
ncbi:MAG TPA: penicillin-binding transpeptidase domain-containing protein, partial [bacterium]|nr:penicillin-binding transpeptidase domain-containing protein [bacterium]